MQTQSRALRILIADPDESVRQDLQRILTEAGHRIADMVSDGTGAVRAVCQRAPDLALFDAVLPQLDGIEAARIVHAEALAPVILLSSDGSPELIRRAIRAGISSFVSKPIQVPTLLTTIEIAAHRWQAMALRQEALQELKENLATRDIVGCAKSILIRRYNIKEQEAFNLLRTRSMNTRRKIRDVAEGIVRAHSAQIDPGFGHEPNPQPGVLPPPYRLRQIDGQAQPVFREKLYNS